MLNNWLKIVPATLAKQAASFPDDSIGKNLILHQKEIPDLKKVKIALIGVGDKEANAVREQLYMCTFPFPKAGVADLGNLRKPDATQLIPVIFELLSGKVLPIILGAKDDLAKAQFLAYQDAKALVNMVTVDEVFRREGVYGSLLNPRHKLLFNFGVLGLQVHQTAPEALNYLSKNNFDLIRLGKSKAAIEETEPVIRDADLLTFHLSALKQSEAPGVAQASPSGFFVEEACQLSRYAGMSDKLSSFGIYGYANELDRNGQTAQVAAQMIWYFMDGYFNRKGDYPTGTGGLTEYVVDFRKLNYQLTFWKSKKSGRWWMQVPVQTKKSQERHRLIPCSFQDYQSACREELPDRLLQAFSRF
ncbi:MAG: arginase family protein [Lewinellaceae bacterium]|nr:arginase family protein [Lewinellaceae bacterium]